MEFDVASVLTEPTWRARQQQYRDLVEPWTQPRLDRRARGTRHPVDDFLFDYYPYSPTKLLTWHPGLGVGLAGTAEEFLAFDEYARTQDCIAADPFRLHDPHGRLQLVLRLLGGTAAREPSTGCFGMHEWAMVYGLDRSEVRHAQLDLRLAPEDIRAAVDDIGLRCTHIDAYRFFTAEATPLNAFVPTRDSQPDLEQPGCLHANMDLYKYAMWFQAYVGSDLVADCFELARGARDLDMRASPYDCSEYGLEPIPVETLEGRRQYARGQVVLLERAAPLRSRLLDTLHALSTVRSAAESVTSRPCD